MEADAVVVDELYIERGGSVGCGLREKMKGIGDDLLYDFLGERCVDNYIVCLEMERSRIG